MRPGQPPGSTASRTSSQFNRNGKWVVESRFAYLLRIQEARSCEIIIGGQFSDLWPLALWP